MQIFNKTISSLLVFSLLPPISATPVDVEQLLSEFQSSFYDITKNFVI